MKFLKLKVENFLSLGKVSLDLGDEGLVLITGRNNDTPGSSSNGAGKSSLWDALCWAIYGKTLRGLSGDEVRNQNGQGGTVVRLTVEKNGESWKIVRTRGVKSSPTLDLYTGDKNLSGQTPSQTQEKIDLLVGLQYTAFRSCLVFGQDSLRFPQMTDKERKLLLENLLGLEVYERAYKLSNQEISGLTLTLNLNNASYLNAKKRLEELDGKIKEQNERLEKDKKLSEGNEKSYRKQLRVLEIEQEALKEFIHEGLERTSKHNQTLEKIATLKEDYQDRLTLIGELEAQRKDLRSGETTRRCPTCSQKIQGDSYRKTLDSLEEKIKDHKSELKKITQEQEEARELARKLEKKLSQVNYYQHEQKYRENETSVVSLKAKLEMCKASESPAKEVLKELESQRSQALKESKESGKSARLFEKRIQRRQFWSKAFGSSGIRSYLLDEVIPYLNQRCEYYANLLGGGFSAQLSPLTKLRSGETVDKLSLNVKTKDGATCYEGASAGERQRIDLCVALSLKDLIRTQSRESLNLMVFDEVFERLDEAGCERVVELLNREKETFGKCFVITHNENLKPFFSDRKVMIKNNGISQLEDHE